MVSGWPGYAVTAVIVAARAFQPNAQPVCDWSWWSWLLMSVPVFLPLYLWIAVGTLWIAARAAIASLDALVRRSGRKRLPS